MRSQRSSVDSDWPLHLSFGPGPQSTDAPCARGDEAEGERSSLRGQPFSDLGREFALDESRLGRKPSERLRMSETDPIRVFLEHGQWLVDYGS